MVYEQEVGSALFAGATECAVVAYVEIGRVYHDDYSHRAHVIGDVHA